MNNPFNRKSRFYDGTQVTSHQLTDLIPKVLLKISDSYHQRASLILATWPEIIGPALSPMTKAVSFIDGTLLIKVKNSTLHSHLNQYEKLRLLTVLKQKFPQIEIKSICFRIG